MGCAEGKGKTEGNGTCEEEVCQELETRERDAMGDPV